MGRAATWSVLVGLVGSACAFDASGLPTSGDDGTGIASSEGSGGTSTSTTSTTSATTKASDSASDDAPADTSTTDDVSSTDPVTTVSESDPSTSSAGDPTGGSSTDESSTGVPHAICGDGMIESPETCETGDLGGFLCSDLGDGYGGTPSCAGCQIDDGPCCIGTGVLCAPGFNDCCNGCGIDFVCD